MHNSHICEYLERMGAMSDYAGENVFKTRAYIKAAELIHHLDKELSEFVKNGGSPEDIPGIGDKIGGLIRELVSTGGSKTYQELASKVPRDFFEMLKISGIGVKKLKTLCESLNINLLDELFDMAKNGRVESVKGFSKKSEQLIIAEIERIKAVGRSKLYYIAAETYSELEILVRNIAVIKNIGRCGELARCLPVITSISMLINISDGSHIESAAKDVMNLTRSVAAKKISSAGAIYISATSELTDIPLQFYISSVSEKSFEAITAFLSYNEDFTNEIISDANGARKIIIPPPAAEDLEAIFNSGEAYNAKIAAIPFIYSQFAWKAYGVKKLLNMTPVDRADIRGTFHIHTTYSDGIDGLETNVRKAIECGLEYIGISDHSKNSFYANGLSEERLIRQIEEIDALNKKYRPFKIFKGVECDILKDGSLDYSDDILSLLDFIVVSVHSNFKMEKRLMTERMQKAISAPYPLMLGHMSGRLLNSRAGYELDYEKVFETAAACGAIIELNCNPHRMDVDPGRMPALKNLGIRISINPDAHCAADICAHLIYGVNGANLGGLSKEDIINTMKLNEIEAFLERMKFERKKCNG